MAHVWVTLTILAFFALCWGLVIGCDRIIGPDEESDLAISDAGDSDHTPTNGESETAGVTQ